MFKRILFALITLLAVPAWSADPWVTRDTALEIASEVGIGIEWAQMLDTSNYHCYGKPQVNGIDAHFLGHYPRRRNINYYFAGWEIAHPIISYDIPNPWRNVWQGATIGFEVAVHQHNTSVGCRIHF